MLAMKRAEAEGMRLEAEGRKALNDAIGENLIRWQTVQNLDRIRFPHINVGSEAITPLLNAIKGIQGAAAAPQPAPAPSPAPAPVATPAPAPAQ